MPNIMRNFRVDPTLWETAKNKASEDDRPLSSVLVSALESYTGVGGEFTVVGNTDLGVADRDMEWDGDGAAGRVFELATDGEDVDTELVGKAFLWRDDEADPTTQAAYSLGFADVVDGSLVIVPAGIAAAAGRLDQTDLPDGAEDEIETRICSVYETVRGQYDDWPACPFSDEEDDDDDIPLTAAASGPTAAIIGHGSLSDSEDPDTQAAVSRVRELLAEGAVGVSIMADMDPDSMPDKAEIDKLMKAEDYEALEELLADVPNRIRHLAVVDTAAFSDARVVAGEDGSIDGPITFEGVWTGDMRFFPVGSVVWENVLPVPIIWDRNDGDHTGTVVGHLHSIERVEGETSSGRPASVPEDAVAASAGMGYSSYPARYFGNQQFGRATSLTVSAPDKSGLRHVYGHIAPHGVCHRSDMAPCFTYPGDIDSTHKGFHTGAGVSLDDGTTVRVGALTLGGSHINPALARQGVSAREVNAHRDNANQVFAMGRAYEDQFGLAFSGVVMPDVKEADIMRAQACAPSVELWPERGGRTLVGAHLVPTPAWPVAASMGSSVEMAGSDNVVVEAAPASTFDLAEVQESLARIESALAVLALDAMTDVPEPE